MCLVKIGWTSRTSPHVPATTLHKIIPREYGILQDHTEKADGFGIYLESFKNSAAICLSDKFFGNISTLTFKILSNKQTAAEFVKNFNRNFTHKSSRLFIQPKLCDYIALHSTYCGRKNRNSKK